ncbi:MAG TPA: GAF domain-containing protein [Dehalococcoidia bacterium]|nr:GAF domain-containing protein [Dehalococcoidia bacterium]
MADAAGAQPGPAPQNETPLLVSARLRQAVNAASASIELRQEDHLRLLEAVVATAARVIDATAGSLMLVDRTAGELEFKVAVGPGSQEIKQFRVPLGEGVAGFTASTGQALAIADTSKDARFARQIAEGSGYVPRNLLCVPLMLGGDVIGVMELLDKGGGATPFTPADTAVLSSFGEQAALAIDLSLQTQSLERLLAGLLHGEDDAELAAEIRAAVAQGEGSPGHYRTLELARQIAAIAGAGERQARLCSAILNAVLEFSRGTGSAEAGLADVMAGLGPAFGAGGVR